MDPSTNIAVSVAPMILVELEARELSNRMNCRSVNLDLSSWSPFFDRARMVARQKRLATLGVPAMSIKALQAVLTRMRILFPWEEHCLDRWLRTNRGLHRSHWTR
eukprot:3657773-Amphidinium_carterae.2